MRAMGIFGGMVLALALVACGAATLTPTDEARVAEDREAQAKCIADGRTRAEVDACRCRVRAAFDRPCDGGAP